MPLPPVTSPDDARVWRGNIPISNRYTVGLAGERFFRELKDHAKIYATRCPKCSMVYAPAATFCERDLAELTEWLEVGPRGIVQSVTTTRIGLDGQPLVQPETFALIQLDGASTVMLHRLASNAIAIGARVEPVFKPAAEREGSINDILHFQAVT
jgi:uncharacterized OB-fold protein